MQNTLDFSIDEDFVDETQYDDDEFYNEIHYDEIQELSSNIVKFIENYFLGKKLHNGKEIDKEMLHLPYYSNIVMNTNIIDGVDKCYKIIKENAFKSEEDDQDIKYMVNTINSIKRVVPKELFGGILLMHLELLEGLEIW